MLASAGEDVCSKPLPKGVDFGFHVLKTAHVGGVGSPEGDEDSANRQEVTNVDGPIEGEMNGQELTPFSGGRSTRRWSR